MRRLAFGIAAAIVLTSEPASAAWKEFKYEDLGMVKEFPADPKMSTGTYETPVAGKAPSHILSLEQDNAIYRVTVVDLHDKLDRGASIMGECVYMAEEAGKPVSNMAARVEADAKAVYGRLVSDDLKDKSRAMTACFYTKGRLYKVEAIILPSNDDYPNSSQAIRFINSLSFDMVGEGPPVGDPGAPLPRKP